MAMRDVADCSEGRCRMQRGSLQIAVRDVADGSEGRC